MVQNDKIKKISVIIPTRNGAATLPEVFAMLTRQSVSFLEILAVDSSSEDNSIAIAKQHGAEVIVIDKQEFDHGGTRTMMARRARGDILLFLTQDAIPAGTDVVAKLIAPLLRDDAIVATYGRQLPSKSASPFAAHLRLFNYPPQSEVRSLKDRDRLGLKTVFFSNSFAAYLKTPLEKTGYFKDGLIFGEDTCTLGSLLLEGRRIAYVADAEVYHSHNYSWLEEFRRSFDIGTLHTMENWLVETFGRAEGHGLAYLRSEFSYLRKNGKLVLIPAYLLRNTLKFLGYQLGRNFTILPESFIHSFSMHSNWWRERGARRKRKAN